MAELASQPTSIQSLYSWYRENRLFVNRRYQRKLVWTLEEKQRLIESILRKFPIPAILIAESETNEGAYEIIDGLQRLHAVLSFIETSYPTLEKRYFDVDSFPTAKKFNDAGVFERTEGIESILETEDTSTLLDYTLQLSVMRGASVREIDDVFDRINTYGHRLSDQERRQAGISNNFSELIRKLASTLRGDASNTTLSLPLMPSISIDLPMTKHGYLVKAEEVFWVSQGILRATELRDSLDEQCIADIAASIIGGSCVERSKNALDKIYTRTDSEYDRISNALDVHGDDLFTDEFNLCIDEIIKVCNATQSEKLRDIIYKKSTTNPFPSLFTLLFIAIYEFLIAENKVISDYDEMKKQLQGLGSRIKTGNKMASPKERRKNVDQIKGIISPIFIPNEEDPRVFHQNTAPDIDASIRRSEIELSNYELKQGILTLGSVRKIDTGILDKLVRTIAAISNNGPLSTGRLLIGVADSESDALKIESLDRISKQIVGRKFVVGVIREAKQLGISMEEYVSIIKDAIRNSDLTDSIKTNVLSSIGYNNYFGYGILSIGIPSAKELAFVGDDVYWRNHDSTEQARDAKKIAAIAKRF